MRNIYKEIERVYGYCLPDELIEIIQQDSYQVSSDVRVLSAQEIIDADIDTGFDFRGENMVPFADCMDGTFLVYHLRDDCYSVYNIDDEMSFDSADSLYDLENYGYLF